MARKTQKEVLARRQDPAAPFLFDEEEMPTKPELLEAVKRGSYRHTGARLLDNDEKALRMVELLLQRRGLKAIAKTMHVSKHTVRAAREVLVARGELAPFKERVVQVFEEIVEVGAQNYLKALENGDVAGAQIPVGVGIIFDKRALALGEPTSIAATLKTAEAAELSVEALNEWFANLRPLEVHSIVSVPEGQQSGTSRVPDAGLDARPQGPTAGAGGGSEAAGSAPGPSDSVSELEPKSA